MTRLGDQQFCLCVQISAAHDLSLLLHLRVVQHMMHLVVYHVVAELVPLRALVLLTLSPAEGDPTFLTCLILFSRRKDRLRARLHQTSVPLRARPK